MSAIQQMLLMKSMAAAVTYATWNPADKDASITLSGGNLTATAASSAWKLVRANMGKSSGKWYWEIPANNLASGDTNAMLGAALSSAPTGSYANPFSWYNTGSTFYSGLSVPSPDNWGNWGSSDVLGFALDMDGLTLKAYRNNTLVGTAYLSAGTWYPQASIYLNGKYVTANFGASAFTYSPPAGYNAGLYE